MVEGTPSHDWPNHDEPETGKEKFPSQVELEAVFQKILKGQPYKIIKLESDEQGVSLFEIEVTIDGEKVTYNYQRAKNNFRDPSLPDGAKFSASIHVTYHDSDGKPAGGQCVANYLDGKWYPRPNFALEHFGDQV